jgi:hypothetical protein
MSNDKPITPFSPSEVKEAINKCTKHKPPGFDLITGLILKELPRKAIVFLTTIYNSILRLACFPITWKFAQIIMIHKPGKLSNSYIVQAHKPPTYYVQNFLKTSLQKDSNAC